MTEDDQLLHDESRRVYQLRASSFSSPWVPVSLDDAIGADLSNSSQDSSSLQEAPACIPPEEAAAISGNLWASAVERQIQSGIPDIPIESSGRSVHLLEF